VHQDVPQGDYSVVYPYLFALFCQVKGADRVKTFENNEPKRGGWIEIIS
jgi:hypothetical protein